LFTFGRQQFHGSRRQRADLHLDRVFSTFPSRGISAAGSFERHEVIFFPLPLPSPEARPLGVGSEVSAGTGRIKRDQEGSEKGIEKRIEEGIEEGDREGIERGIEQRIS
jgi:hypothetical protein